MNHACNMDKTGFSLVEVNLAIVLIAVGMLTLFTLFPVGLRESEYSVMDTHEASFADNMMSAMKGNAMDISSYEDWLDMETFCYLLVDGTEPRLVTPTPGTAQGWPADTIYVGELSGIGTGVPYPDVNLVKYAPRLIRYRLIVKSVGSGPSQKYHIELWVRSGKYGQLEETSSVFMTEVAFMGM